MAKRLWPAVYAMLLTTIAESEPYDVDGGILLLHAMAGNAEMPAPTGTRAANLCHLTAVMDEGGEHREAARRSLVEIVSELERASRQRA